MGKVQLREGLGKSPWGRARLTTYIATEHIAALRTISEKTQIPMGRLVDQALDEYLKLIGWQDEPSVPPIDPKYISKRIQMGKADRT